MLLENKLKHMKKVRFVWATAHLNLAAPNQKWLGTPYQQDVGQDFYREVQQENNLAVTYIVALLEKG